MRYCLLCVLILLQYAYAGAQTVQCDDSSYSSKDNLWEELFETIRNDEDNPVMIDEVLQIEENRIDLNTASFEELKRIPLISNIVASRITARRDTVQFVSTSELMEVDGVSHEMYLLINKFVKVENKVGMNVKGRLISNVSSEIERRRGYISGEYLGSSIKILSRLKLTAESRDPSWELKKIEMGMLAEKDPGERIEENFHTGYVSLSFVPLSASIVIGDYRMGSAEGLVFGGGLMTSKKDELMMQSHRSGAGVIPHLSSEENSFFRGFAVSLETRDIHIQFLYSNKPINAALDSSGCIKNIDYTGLFRTDSECKKKSATKETMLGHRITVTPVKGLRIGETGYRSDYANPLILINQSEILKSNLNMQSFDISYISKKTDLFMELTVDRSGESTFIGGMAYEPEKYITLTAAVRKYPSSFQSVHGSYLSGFSGWSQSEEGIYLSLKTRLFDFLKVYSYYDQFRGRDISRIIRESLRGNEFVAIADCGVMKNFNVKFKFRKKDAPEIEEEYDGYGRIVQKAGSRVQKNFQFTGEFNSSSSLRLRNRIELVDIGHGISKRTEQGVLISQSIKWALKNLLVLQARLAFYETDSYDSRIYEFEEDLPYVFSNIALYGRGTRWYFIAKYDPFSSITIAFKFSQTLKNDIASLGTGLDEIKGDKKSYISFHLDVEM